MEPEPTAVPGEAGAESAPPQAQAITRPAGGNVDHYRMSMPVELWFGESHMGVKAGSATCAEFLRLANAIIADYRSASMPKG